MFFFFQAEDGIRDLTVTGVQTCALPISQLRRGAAARGRGGTHGGGRAVRPPDRRRRGSGGGGGADRGGARLPPRGQGDQGGAAGARAGGRRAPRVRAISRSSPCRPRRTTAWRN